MVTDGLLNEKDISSGWWYFVSHSETLPTFYNKKSKNDLIKKIKEILTNNKAIINVDFYGAIYWYSGLNSENYKYQKL